MPVLQDSPVADHVAAVVAFVRHHDDDGVATEGIEAPLDRTAEAVRAGAAHGHQAWNSCGGRLEDGVGVVAAAVIDDDDLMVDALKRELKMQVFHRRGDAARFVACRNHHRKLPELPARGSRQRNHVGLIHGGCATGVNHR